MHFTSSIGKALNSYNVEKRESDPPSPPPPNPPALANIYCVQKQSVRQKEGDEKEEKQHLKFQNVF